MRSLLYLSRLPDATLVVYLRGRDWHVRTLRGIAEAAKCPLAERAGAGIIDFRGLPARDLTVLETLLRDPASSRIAIVGEAELNDPLVRRLIRQYCFDFVRYPAAFETLNALAGHAWGMLALADPDPAGSTPAAGEERMVGRSEPMQQLFKTIRKVAGTDAPVFIAGESGTGKELTALAIHERSSRRLAPFVAINCGAIPHALLQSELFGHERGAFTGAMQRKIGRIEAAHGGTLFLDEIGDMPIESQASLLRFLQERTIERLGGHTPIPVDVRVVCATHVDLDGGIEDGRFRADLYHRLCVLRINEPPLRERGTDIDLLAQHLLARFQSDGERRLRGFTPEAIEAMHRYAWPGNVREMINRIRRAIVMCETRLLSAADLGLDAFASQQAITLADARDAAERRTIEAALLRHRGRLTDAAVELGISRATLYRLME
ncbi:MAG: Transcriptional regulatory protein ZraR [Burkholderia plantarii]|nr:MAG: Transcriptional regulatory protein ZraR [Burkholderia plantarii]